MHVLSTLLISAHEDLLLMTPTSCSQLSAYKLCYSNEQANVGNSELKTFKLLCTLMVLCKGTALNVLKSSECFSLKEKKNKESH